MLPGKRTKKTLACVFAGANVLGMGKRDNRPVLIYRLWYHTVSASEAILTQGTISSTYLGLRICGLLSYEPQAGARHLFHSGPPWLLIAAISCAPCIVPVVSWNGNIICPVIQW